LELGLLPLQQLAKLHATVFGVPKPSHGGVVVILQIAGAVLPVSSPCGVVVCPARLGRKLHSQGEQNGDMISF
jgi:hypothetical protein